MWGLEMDDIYVCYECEIQNVLGTEQYFEEYDEPYCEKCFEAIKEGEKK